MLQIHLTEYATYVGTLSQYESEDRNEDEEAFENTTTGEERYRNKKDKKMKSTLVCLYTCVCKITYMCVFAYVCVILIVYVVNFWLTRTVFKSIRILFPTLTFLPSGF